MTEKLIIDNRTDLPMDEVLLMAFSVVRMGRVSGDNDRYCYATRFYNGVVCEATKNKKSDTLVFVKQEK